MDLGLKSKFGPVSLSKPVGTETSGSLAAMVAWEKKTSSLQRLNSIKTLWLFWAITAFVRTECSQTLDLCVTWRYFNLPLQPFAARLPSILDISISISSQCRQSHIWAARLVPQSACFLSSPSAYFFCVLSIWVGVTSTLVSDTATMFCVSKNMSQTLATARDCKLLRLMDQIHKAIACFCTRK